MEFVHFSRSSTHPSHKGVPISYDSGSMLKQSNYGKDLSFVADFFPSSEGSKIFLLQGNP